MKAKHLEELENKVIALLRKNNKEENIKSDENVKQNFIECYKSYEIKVIMNAIIKISALLAMSIGEAGGEIIHKNLSSSHSLHFHSRGKKKYAIFGFCNIRNFEEINLVLQEKTVPLINQIAEIVHSSVDIFRGNTNKNIGDSFFNVWKFYNNINAKKNKDKTLIKDNLLEIDPLNPQINITADCAVLAYLRCILKINKNLNILFYNNNPNLNQIIPNFKISMGFGLHLGYGIEGPIGSVFKMEASYLSPNVNIAARLETATKQFGVSLLISGKLYNLFTEEMKEVCRYVDCVRVKGSSEPIDLYTIDINYNVTHQSREKIGIVKSLEEKEKYFKEKKLMVEDLIEEYGSITPIILEKDSYLELIEEKSDIFYQAWENAIKSYKEGDWGKAKQYFEECLRDDSDDGPANTLYNYIKSFNFQSPKDWKGERELFSK
jgi:class 3 adenylate cyclase